MIIISQVEPIVEPIFENEFWYLPTRASLSARAASMISLIGHHQQQQQQQPGSERRNIPPFEYNDRYLQYFGLPRFQPDELKIQMNMNNHQIIIDGEYENIDEWEYESYRFTKRILIPDNVDMKSMKCFIAENGLLQIEAPLIRDQDRMPSDVVDGGFVDQQQQQQEQHQSKPKEEKFIKIEHGKQESAPINQLQTTTKMIPIEFITDNQGTDAADDNDKPEPIGEKTFSAKKHESLERSARPVKPSASITQPPPPPPPHQIRQMIQEVPIRMVRRPIDQGILCPCCRGRGSTSESHHDGYNRHNYPQLVAYRQGGNSGQNKKDYQPKNAQQQSPTARTTAKTTSTSTSTSDLNQAIDELQKVVTKMS